MFYTSTAASLVTHVSMYHAQYFLIYVDDEWESHLIPWYLAIKRTPREGTELPPSQQWRRLSQEGMRRRCPKPRWWKTH